MSRQKGSALFSGRDQAQGGSESHPLSRAGPRWPALPHLSSLSSSPHLRLGAANLTGERGPPCGGLRQGENGVVPSLGGVPGCPRRLHACARVVLGTLVGHAHRPFPTGGVRRSWCPECVHSRILPPPPTSKRKDSEPRTKCLLNNADLAPHHPKDPVEMRRINFQTPGVCLSRAPGPTPTGNRKPPPGDPPLSRQAVLRAVQVPTPKPRRGSRRDAPELVLLTAKRDVKSCVSLVVAVCWEEVAPAPARPCWQGELCFCAHRPSSALGFPAPPGCAPGKAQRPCLALPGHRCSPPASEQLPVDGRGAAEVTWWGH